MQGKVITPYYKGTIETFIIAMFFDRLLKSMKDAKKISVTLVQRYSALEML